jgi:hypothetical protein
MVRCACSAFLVGCVFALTACGGGGNNDSGAEALAKQQELAQARHQAAQDARQSAHIEELERRLNRVKRARSAAPAPESTTSTTAERAPGSPSTGGDWPGGSAYTAIVGSLQSEAEARALQRQASDRGLDAGVLFSSDYSSLRPGYWVVFSGNFDSVSEAAARVARAQQLGYSDAYPRFVAP